MEAPTSPTAKLIKDLLGENPISEEDLTTLITHLETAALTTVDYLARAPSTLIDVVINKYPNETAKALARLRLNVIIEEAQARKALKRKRAEFEVESFDLTKGLINLVSHVGPIGRKAPPDMIPQTRFLTKLQKDPYMYVRMSELHSALDLDDPTITTKENLETGKPVHVRLAPSRPVVSLGHWITCFMRYGVALMMILSSREEVSPLAILSYVSLAVKLSETKGFSIAATFDQQYRARAAGYRARGWNWASILADPGTVDSALLVSARVGALKEESSTKHQRDLKTVVCKYFRQGRCLQGDKCRFKHSVEESKPNAPKSYFDESVEKAFRKNRDPPSPKRSRKAPLPEVGK
ncbi:hypothetical protein Pmar_PMAR010723 [Perkinsus marinus ATCC 50983]|uniref:C3H1-type domain-containing protein n=1 Tax=Perkinsus marinus (strain ATCC 50983 / TXsc) TaxID=423536 RepID=C5L0F7_PERM5|nr:hypothetical protein Pmar_PMAR010723 [Perkinsus marinus ATCC 50983]EER09780.1 hypothetical protein Pmar_PMAR010723 [Perkinsus marinus ATCC 50983]|eukprot:XP_002777985.1 hypothetical protein Pmar_PMAR010723 [Perkinsus marinus ATCC 50983]